jgi:hypothetical protein
MRVLYHLFLACVAGLVAGLTLRFAPVQAADPVAPAAITVSSLTLVDKAGTVRAKLEVSPDTSTPALRFYSTERKLSGAMGEVTGGGFVYLCDSNGDPRLSLLTTPADGGFILARKPNGQHSASWPE